MSEHTDLGTPVGRGSATANPPRLITSRDLIRGVAATWRAQYYHDAAQLWSFVAGGSAQTIYDQLCVLDVETATHADVAAIIGNGSWTRVWCNGCETNVEVAVEVGAPPDYESSTATLCPSCLAAAVSLVLHHAGGVPK